MTNFEKYSEGIIKIMKDGDMPAKKGDKIVPCLKIPCKECDFHDNKNGCMFDRNWLYEDDGEPSQLEKENEKLNEKIANLKIQNGKLTEKIENLKKQNGKLARKLQNQREEITRLLEAQKEKYQSGLEDGYVSGWEAGHSAGRREYENRKNFKVGDVVRLKAFTNIEILVTEVDENLICGIEIKNGDVYSNRDKEDWEPTGRHIDLQDLLKQIPRGEENDNR